MILLLQCDCKSLTFVCEDFLDSNLHNTKSLCHIPSEFLRALVTTKKLIIKLDRRHGFVVGRNPALFQIKSTTARTRKLLLAHNRQRLRWHRVIRVTIFLIIV